MPVPEKEPAAITAVSPANDEELASIRDQLFKMLRMSPRLTSALVIDPTLLGYQEHMSHSNPELEIMDAGDPWVSLIGYCPAFWYDQDD